MFTITMGKGFRIEFPNGWIVSVQWGPGNYCNNQSNGYFSGEIPQGHYACANAEVGIFRADHSPSDEMEIHGWQTPKEVAGHIMEVAMRSDQIPADPSISRPLTK